MSKTNQFTFQEIMHSVAIVFVWLPKRFYQVTNNLYFPKLYARRFNADIIIEAYAQKLKKNKIEPYFVDLLRTIKLEYGDNFLSTRWFTHSLCLEKIFCKFKICGANQVASPYLLHD